MSYFFGWLVKLPIEILSQDASLGMRKNEKEDKNMKFEEMEIKLELFNPKVSQAISSKFETEKVKQSQNLLFKKGSIETLPNLLFFLCVVFTILIRC